MKHKKRKDELMPKGTKKGCFLDAAKKRKMNISHMKNFLRVYELEKFDKHNREENILLVNQ
jgi:hypothetical protein